MAKWKKGKIKFDDGTEYRADLLVNDDGQVWNTRVYKDGQVVEEVDAKGFATKLGKNEEQVYPYSYELNE